VQGCCGMKNVDVINYTAFLSVFSGVFGISFLDLETPILGYPLLIIALWSSIVFMITPIYDNKKVLS